MTHPLRPRLGAWSRLASWLRATRYELEVATLVLLVLVTVGFGCVGFRAHAAANGRVLGPLDILYLTLQLFTLESGPVAPPVPWMLQIARFAAPAIAVYTALKALAFLFRDQLQRWRMVFSSGHVVICGLGGKGLAAARAYRGRRRRVVVIEKDDDNGSIQRCRDEGMVVVVADATDPAVLRRCRVRRASVVAALTGDDSANAEVAIQVQEIVRGALRFPQCVVHIVDVQLRNLVGGSELETRQTGVVPIVFFNVYDSAARAVHDSNPPFAGRPDHVRDGHVVVVGVGQMGESLIAHFGRAWRREPALEGRRVIVSLVDRLASAKRDRVLARYPWFDTVAELRPFDIEVTSGEFERAAFLVQDGVRADSAYVCLGDDAVSLRAGFGLALQVGMEETPVVVRMTHRAGLATLMGKEASGPRNLHTFGLLETACTPDTMLEGLTELVARAMHREYVRAEEAKGLTTRDNAALVPWKALPEPLKEANRQQARHIGDKLREIGCHRVRLREQDVGSFCFTPGEVELLARSEHERWVARKLEAGWKHAPLRDDVRKLHHDMLPWDDPRLSEPTRDKDRQAVRAIPGLLEDVGYAIERRPSSAAKPDLPALARAAAQHTLDPLDQPRSR